MYKVSSKAWVIVNDENNTFRVVATRTQARKLKKGKERVVRVFVKLSEIKS